MFMKKTVVGNLISKAEEIVMQLNGIQKSRRHGFVEVIIHGS
jgi:hypothetical protein